MGGGLQKTESLISAIRSLIAKYQRTVTITMMNCKYKTDILHCLRKRNKCRTNIL